MTSRTSRNQSTFWWNNAIFFCGTHLAAAYGVYHRPLATIPKAILVATVVLWQLASFGITIGYHRLYSHRSFNASLGVRIALALVGASAFQGSIKWWCLRHRLHHRFTDDEKNDPYCATRGLLFSHVGWIFFKPNYEKLHLIERKDLEEDPVVRLQHRYFVPLAIFLGIIFPTVLGATYGDTDGGFIYAGLVARLLIWHSTFLVNSLAHWDGLQPYSDENTSRTNLLLALFTAGEGNHNFHHAFPHDYRSGPAKTDWDPSKWVILLLAKLGFAWGLRRARTEDIAAARAHVLAHSHGHRQTHEKAVEQGEWMGPMWTEAELKAHVKANDACIVLIDGYAIDVTGYMDTHPGGAGLLHEYAVFASPDEGSNKWNKAGWAFDGGVNKHSQVARRRMKQLRIARIL
ncbi:fatty acid desaturase-domain-containing protein [Multifurca ochricompacta]|uniref:Acyl-CoA desaturase n=1 Tax=Multifurca ochricompacta TaxID=376703 RepID=A0AAD4QKP7_9AGAM|nr:fatty acid desaturase-domain-containing protein [Multifurca ochricompacta]